VSSRESRRNSLREAKGGIGEKKSNGTLTGPKIKGKGGYAEARGKRGKNSLKKGSAKAQSADRDWKEE